MVEITTTEYDFMLELAKKKVERKIQDEFLKMIDTMYDIEVKEIKSEYSYFWRKYMLIYTPKSPLLQPLSTKFTIGIDPRFD